MWPFGKFRWVMSCWLSCVCFVHLPSPPLLAKKQPGESTGPGARGVEAAYNKKLRTRAYLLLHSRCARIAER